MTLNVDKQWFMERWSEKGLSLRKVAKLIDLDPGALSYSLSGKRQMKLQEVGKIATIMNVSREEVLAHIDGGTTISVATSKKEQGRESGLRTGRHPGFGFMKDMITIEKGFDVTRPFDDQPWDQGYLGEGDTK